MTKRNRSPTFSNYAPVRRILSLRKLGFIPLKGRLGRQQPRRCEGSPRRRLRGGRTSRHPDFGDIVTGVFTPVLAKHTKRFSLVDAVSVGVDRMQRSFEPMQRQVETWRASRIQDEAAKLVIYRAFVEGDLEVPKHLARRVHDLYFNPTIEEFAPRTLWSLENSFTSAFKELDPIPQFRATAKLAPFLEGIPKLAP